MAFDCSKCSPVFRRAYFTISGLFAILLWVSSLPRVEAQEQKTCFYTDSKGIFRISNGGYDGVPEEFRQSAQCHKSDKPKPSSLTPKYSETSSRQASSGSQKSSTHRDSGGRPAPIPGRGAEAHLTPDQVTLKGTTRDYDFTSSIGSVHLRWQTDVSQYFGKTPHDAVKIAWQAGTKTLGRNSFPGWLRSSSYEWNIVFMDEAATKRTHPFAGEFCHPAWIRPPAQIYVSAQLIGTQCNSGRLTHAEAVAQLNRTLLHEFGHAIEYQMLGPAISRAQRYHSEGFAEVFESLAVENLDGSYRQSVREEMRKRARMVFDPNWRATEFQGSGADYSRAYALMATVVEKRGLSGLSKIYETMRNSSLSFEAALTEVTGWSEERWYKEAARHIGVL